MAIILVKVTDNPGGQDDPGRWRAGEIVEAFPDDHAFSAKEQPEAGNFFHVQITDRTVEQVQQYLERWDYRPVVSVVGSQPPNYRIRVTSNRVGPTGVGRFTRAGVERLLQVLDGFGAAYHDHGASANTSWFEFDVFGITPDEREVAREEITRAVDDMGVRRRVWGVNATGMRILANNNGRTSARAAQVDNFLVNKLTTG